LANVKGSTKNIFFDPDRFSIPYGIDFSRLLAEKVWLAYQLLLSALITKHFVHVIMFIVSELYELLISVFYIFVFNPR